MPASDGISNLTQPPAAGKMTAFPPSISRPCVARRINKAFSLIEVLLVIGIVSILMAVAVPATRSIINANQVTAGTQLVVDQLTYARQTAVTRNRTVEVRFYSFVPPDDPTAARRISAMEPIIYDEDNVKATQLKEVRHLPSNAEISSNATFSSLMASGQTKAGWTGDDPKRALPRGVEGNYDAYVFRFKPDGSTNLGPGNWFLTIHGSNQTGAALPPNYATIHIDRYNGSLRLYRPD